MTKHIAFRDTMVASLPKPDMFRHLKHISDTVSPVELCPIGKLWNETTSLLNFKIPRDVISLREVHFTCICNRYIKRLWDEAMEVVVGVLFWNSSATEKYHTLFGILVVVVIVNENALLLRVTFQATIPQEKSC